ncbi:MAG TPA: TIGR00341 family protein [Oscillatoriales cyanobacterium M59_W2019_021]|nr:TIGR00341 family protein [Oscillatoriales cyanobacterium M4454_W2019_049]HIK52039.1 TIGR00341 family protein [Oscillatoriales cyanobacterium M59_W2019_021]
MQSRLWKLWSIQKQNWLDFWHAHSGDWHWLAEKPMPIAGLNRRLWRISVASFSFCLLLTLSSTIATLGLLANSVATIIGAMIIAPLMGPMVGMAYAMVVGNRRLLRRSFLTALTGVILTIVTSAAIAYTIGLRAVGSEILARANPTLIDLGVALAAGAAGSFANSRRSIADALPGVAIAVALVPPLSTIGIGIALGQQSLAVGALLLFLTNFTAIVFSGALVFLLQRYGNIQKAQRGLSISVFLLFLLGIPLGFSLKNLLVQENVRRNIGDLIRRQTLTFADRDIRSIRVRDFRGDALFVEIEISAPFGSISPLQVNLVRDFLSQKLEKPINLQVRAIPIEILESEPTSIDVP